MKIKPRKVTGYLIVFLLAATFSGCDKSEETPVGQGETLKTQILAADGRALTVEDAQAYVEDAEKRLEAISEYASKAAWIAQTFITEDTQYIEARANEQVKLLTVELANGAARFNGMDLPYDVARKLALIKLRLTLPAPAAQPEKAAELARIESKLSALYGSGIDADGVKHDLIALSDLMAESDDPKALLKAWVEWRKVGPQMKPLYTRQAQIANEGARDLGFADVGALWRSQYDMPPDVFAADMDRVWGQVKPLYESLHCHVRAQLNEKYGDAVVAKQGPIPAHLLGNMWAQQWGHIYDVAAPAGTQGIDVTTRLKLKGYEPKAMVRQAEGFFTSLGFAPMPDTFWTRSMFIRPVDHEAVCHASAWDLSTQDYRIKMCIQVTGEEFNVIHHELGHNFYQRAYNLKQPVLYRGSANDGFHEAIGDTVALSITPRYLKQIGLIAQEPDASGDLPFLMRMAMDKVAFLPFGLLVDKWRWQVFSGELTPDHYNAGWWDLRRTYQGIKAPVVRTENDFDPGAKYHIPGNTPYSRYFLAHIMQFQFHKALCDAAGYQGPLHRCSIYNSKQAGEKLMAMLEMGQSRPWQEAMQTMTGQDKLDASALLEYFAPLQHWLDEQNKGRECGW